jgi:hypothetical protein
MRRCPLRLLGAKGCCHKIDAGTPAVVSKNKSAGDRAILREEKSKPIARLAQHNSQYSLTGLHLDCHRRADWLDPDK